MFTYVFQKNVRLDIVVHEKFLNVPSKDNKIHWYWKKKVLNKFLDFLIIESVFVSFIDTSK